MNFEKQANDFLKKNNAIIEIRKSQIQLSPEWAKGGMHGFKYSITIGRDGHRDYIFNFWGSINDRQKLIKPTNYDILACVTKHEPEDFKEFCSCFGYDEIDEETGIVDQKNYSIYKSVIKEWENVNRLFSDVMDDLREIQ
ncbi:MAG: hypothetical protein ACTSQH_00385 [Candidatus Hodarchaeales archaeon]